MASKLSDQLVEAQSKLMEADQTAAQLKPIEDAKKHVSPLFLLSPPPEVTPPHATPHATHGHGPQRTLHGVACIAFFARASHCTTYGHHLWPFRLSLGPSETKA